MGTGQRLTRKEADALPHAIRANEYHQRPAGMLALAVQVERLAAWAKSFNIPHDTKMMAMMYEDLASLPDQLIEKAFTRAMNSAKDTFRLPMCASIRAQVSDEMGRRWSVTSGLKKMEMAMKRGDVEKRSGGKATNPAFVQAMTDLAALKLASNLREDEMRRAAPKAIFKPSHVPNPDAEKRND